MEAKRWTWCNPAKTAFTRLLFLTMRSRNLAVWEKPRSESASKKSSHSSSSSRSRLFGSAFSQSSISSSTTAAESFLGRRLVVKSVLSRASLRTSHRASGRLVVAMGRAAA